MEEVEKAAHEDGEVPAAYRVKARAAFYTLLPLSERGDEEGKADRRGSRHYSLRRRRSWRRRLLIPPR